MGALRPVEEVEVREDRAPVAAEADRQPTVHGVEVERRIALVVLSPPYVGARSRRNVDLGLDPRH